MKIETPDYLEETNVLRSKLLCLINDYRYRTGLSIDYIWVANHKINSSKGSSFVGGVLTVNALSLEDGWQYSWINGQCFEIRKDHL